MFIFKPRAVCTAGSNDHFVVVLPRLVHFDGSTQQGGATVQYLYCAITQPCKHIVITQPSNTNSAITQPFDAIVYVIPNLISIDLLFQLNHLATMLMTVRHSKMTPIRLLFLAMETPNRFANGLRKVPPLTPRMDTAPLMKSEELITLLLRN
jgi:hypothetical protein